MFSLYDIKIDKNLVVLIIVVCLKFFTWIRKTSSSRTVN